MFPNAAWKNYAANCGDGTRNMGDVLCCFVTERFSCDDRRNPIEEKGRVYFMEK